MPVKSICVFCGSRPGVDPAYTADAEAMGKGIAAKGWRLVYGAGDVGLEHDPERRGFQCGSGCQWADACAASLYFRIRVHGYLFAL